MISIGGGKGNLGSTTLFARPIVDGAGNLTFAGQTWFRNTDTLLTNAFDPQGKLQPSAAPASQLAPTPLTDAVTPSGATAGTAAALPALPAGYLEWSINGHVYKIPYYNI